MRTRTRKHIGKQVTTTKKSVYLLAVFIFLLVFIGLWILMYELYKITGGFQGIIIIGLIFSGILFLSFKSLSNEGGSVIKTKSKKPISQRLVQAQKSVLSEKYIHNKNFLNHHNYHASPSLKSNYFKQNNLKEVFGLIRTIVLSGLFYIIMTYLINGSLMKGDDFTVIFISIFITIIGLSITELLPFKGKFLYLSMNPKKYHKDKKYIFFY